MTKPVTGTKPPPPGMTVHGNEYHDPDFEEEGAAATQIEAHRAGAVHDQPQLPVDHTHQAAGGGVGGKLDHGLALNGLLHDDHPQYIRHALATAVSDFLVASGAGTFVKQTLAQVRTLLNWAADIATHSALATGIHGVGASIVDSVAARIAAIAAHAALANAHHAQDHSASHEPGGADTMAVDQAAGTGSLRTLGGGAVQAAPGNHTHTLVNDTSYYEVGSHQAGSSGTYYRYQRLLGGGAEYTFATQSVAFAAGSRAFGVAMGHCMASRANAAKLRMYLGGVLVGESSYFSAGVDYMRVAMGFRALSGAQTCKVTGKNNSPFGTYFRFFSSDSYVRQAVGFAVGSIKI